jgi:AcrR family transcriptional regulator
MSPRVGLDRAALVQAAAELADTEGLEQLTLARLAEQLGIRAASLYNHIEGVPGLRRELALLGIRQMSQRLGRAAIGKAGDEAVMAIADAHRSFAKAHPGLYAATLWAPDSSDPEWQAAWRDLVEIMLTVLRPYDLSEEEAIHTMRGLRSVIHGFVALEAAGAFVLASDLDESFHRLIQTLIHGLACPVGTELEYRR